LKGANGKTLTVHVVDPDLQAKLAALKPGQVVQMDYTESLADDIRPAAQ
jgi:hypothetical protein